MIESIWIYGFEETQIKNVSGRLIRFKEFLAPRSHFHRSFKLHTYRKRVGATGVEELFEAIPTQFTGHTKIEKVDFSVYSVNAEIKVHQDRELFVALSEANHVLLHYELISSFTEGAIL